MHQRRNKDFVGLACVQNVISRCPEMGLPGMRAETNDALLLTLSPSEDDELKRSKGHAKATMVLNTINHR